jgi:hypothetical protein
MINAQQAQILSMSQGTPMQQAFYEQAQQFSREN